MSCERWSDSLGERTRSRPRHAEGWEPLPASALRRGHRLWSACSLTPEGPSGSQTFNLLVAPSMLVRYRFAGYRILHIHWVFQFSFPWAPRAVLARRTVMQWWFWFYLWSADALGYRIVWTAHDLLPHDQVFFDDGQARQYLIERADAVVALSRATAADLVELGATDVRVIPSCPLPHRTRQSSDGRRREKRLAWWQMTSSCC